MNARARRWRRRRLLRFWGSAAGDLVLLFGVFVVVTVVVPVSVALVVYWLSFAR